MSHQAADLPRACFVKFACGLREGLADTGVVTGSSVPPYYDSLVAKVIAHGPTRDEALDRLRQLPRDRLFRTESDLRNLDPERRRTPGDR